jgi:outer membrane protein TolC
LLGAAGVDAAALPEPLTLDAALETAQNPAHYELVELDQQMQVVAGELGIEENYGFNLDLRGRLAKVGPSDYAPDTPDDDSAAQLVLSKPIYDFGLRDSREDYLALQLQALESQKQLLIERRRLKIMERYFEVLNADNEFLAENEAMAIGYIRYDNAREDFEMGLVSQSEVLRLQATYETIRQQREQAMHRQRLNRAMLAEAMGYPEQIPSSLEIPSIDTGRKIPENFDGLLERALTNSLEARLANTNARVAQAAIGIAEDSDNARLDLELEVATYARDSRLRDDWRAVLLFDIPLYSGASPEKVNLAQARHRLALANQQQLESQLRLEVLELWQRIQRLALKIKGDAIGQRYLEYDLDRSRAEYELEFKTDLGDSMVLYTRGNSERQRTLYDYELAYQRLGALVGEDYLKQLEPVQ